MSNKPGESPFDSYVRRVLTYLHALPPELRDAVAVELRAHLHDAAAEVGRSDADPAFQAETIRALGSPRRLGRSLARVHRAEQHGHQPWLWWAWIAASLIGWPAGILLGARIATEPFSTAPLGPLLWGGAVTSLLHWGVLVRAYPGGRRQLGAAVLFCGAWLLGALLAPLVPFGTFWEPIAELVLIVYPLGWGLLVGLLQRQAMRLLVGRCVLWPGATGLALVVSVVLALTTANLLLAVQLGELWAGVGAVLVLGALYGAITGAVLASTFGTKLRSMAGGGALPAPRPSRRPLLSHAVVALLALPVLWASWSMLDAAPVITSGSTTEISAANVELFNLEAGRTGLRLPDRAATLWVHEDHQSLLRRHALELARRRIPIAITVYTKDLEQLDRPVRVRALQIRSAETVYLSLDTVAAGRNPAEPVLLIGVLGPAAIVATELLGALGGRARARR